LQTYPKREQLPAAPKPLRDTACGLPAALSVILNAALRVPLAVGVNVTPMLQLALGAKEVPHLLVWAKSPGSVPLMAILMVRMLMPTLVKVTFCGEPVVPIVTDPKFRLVGESFAVVPIPLRLTFCGLPAALSEMLSAAVRVPEAVGLKVMLMPQLAPAANELPQV